MLKQWSWDVKLQTAISNIEVNNEPTTQLMYYIKYKVQETNEDLIVATVRTETLLSDVAIVYNPKDKKYLKYKGMHVIHPLTKKVLPIIAEWICWPKFWYWINETFCSCGSGYRYNKKIRIRN
ncbi:Valine--tRNA ligase (plasmid) [Mycoplasmopsis canis]|uniref:valine--tRNA ligase n=1 Tax=Mycoplasmopsis canis TaxID=29555 RepID=A0A449ASK2_9BACT|nr:class I tRNA ligase family protein [Mycoplasmopsis canis]VEU69332.1 Valine--tRNA ligase [Mycoplasmopsis canis]